MKLDNNVSLTGFTTLTRNAIIACYVAHLAAGNTLLCKSIHMLLSLSTLVQR